jgi:hypothetical protein
LRLRVCDFLNMFKVGKHVQVFNRIFVRVEFIMLNGFNASGRAANRHIVLVCNLKVFRIV